MNTTRKTLLKRGVGLALGVPLLGGLGATAVWPVLRDQELAAARADGVPTEPADLRPNPPVPPERNAGPLLIELTRRTPPWDDSRAKVWRKAGDTLRKTPDDPAARTAVAEGIARYGDLFALAEKAAALPDCDFAYDWGRADVPMPELATARDGAKAFSTRAALTQDPDAAAADALRAARLGALIGQTPGLIPAMVAVSLDAVAHAALIRDAIRLGRDAARLQPFVDAHAAFPPPPKPVDVFRGEPVTERVALRQLRDGTADAGSLARLRPLMVVMGVPWERQIVRFWREAFAILRSTDDPIALHARLKPMVARWQASNLPQDQLMKLLVPVLSQAVEKVQFESIVRRDLRNVAFELLAQRNAGRPYPESREMPIDPYSRKPLVYRREGKGCVFYSVAKRKDDGAPYDLVVRLPA